MAVADEHPIAVLTAVLRQGGPLAQVVKQGPLRARLEPGQHHAPVHQHDQDVGMVAALGAVEDQRDADRLLLVEPDNLGLVQESVEPGLQAGFAGHRAVQLRAVGGRHWTAPAPCSSPASLRAAAVVLAAMGDAPLLSTPRVNLCLCRSVQRLPPVMFLATVPGPAATRREGPGEVEGLVSDLP
jgi:hypothetical protein